MAADINIIVDRINEYLDKFQIKGKIIMHEMPDTGYVVVYNISENTVNNDFDVNSYKAMTNNIAICESDLFDYEHSYTTREKRSEDDDHSFFVDKKEFKQMIDHGQMISWFSVGNTTNYGIAYQSIDTVLNQGKCCVLSSLNQTELNKVKDRYSVIEVICGI